MKSFIDIASENIYYRCSLKSNKLTLFLVPLSKPVVVGSALLKRSIFKHLIHLNGNIRSHIGIGSFPSAMKPKVRPPADTVSFTSSFIFSPIE